MGGGLFFGSALGWANSQDYSVSSMYVLRCLFLSLSFVFCL